jgi:hypothetical protein
MRPRRYLNEHEQNAPSALSEQNAPLAHSQAHVSQSKETVVNTEHDTSHTNITTQQEQEGTSEEEIPSRQPPPRRSSHHSRRQLAGYSKEQLIDIYLNEQLSFNSRSRSRTNSRERYRSPSPSYSDSGQMRRHDMPRRHRSKKRSARQDKHRRSPPPERVDTAQTTFEVLKEMASFARNMSGQMGQLSATMSVPLGRRALTNEQREATGTRYYELVFKTKL